MSRFGDMTVFGKVRSTFDADGSGQRLLDLVERIVGPDAGVERLGGLRRPMTKGPGHGFNRCATVLRNLRERGPEGPQGETYPASSFQDAFQLAQHRVGPRADLAAHA